MNAIVKKFLEKNEVKTGWLNLILQSNDLTQKLGVINNNNNNNNNNFIYIALKSNNCPKRYLITK